MNQQVTVNASNQIGISPNNFNFFPPRPVSLNTLNNVRKTEGAYTLTVVGVNMGSDFAASTVTVGGQQCTPTAASHTAIECTMPEGRDRVHVMNQFDDLHRCWSEQSCGSNSRYSTGNCTAFMGFCCPPSVSSNCCYVHACSTNTQYQQIEGCTSSGNAAIDCPITTSSR